MLTSMGKMRPSSPLQVTRAGTFASRRTRPSETSLLRIRGSALVQITLATSGSVSGTTLSCPSESKMV